MNSPKMKGSLPALVTILLCLLVQAIEQGLQIGTPHVMNVSAGRFHTAIVLNVVLLICLPFIGAIGASFARHLGHTRNAAVECVMSPVGLISAMLVTLFVVDSITTRALVSSLAYSSGILMGWVVIPAAALLIGCAAGWRLTPERRWYERCF